MNEKDDILHVKTISGSAKKRIPIRIMIKNIQQLKSSDILHNIYLSHAVLGKEECEAVC